MIRVGINGFGRIGRAVFRINANNPRFQIVAINDLDPNVKNHAYLLKYDSYYGKFPGKIHAEDASENALGKMIVDGDQIAFYCKDNIADVPWEEQGVNVVIDASGVQQNVLNARALIGRGTVRKTVITHAPRKGLDHTIIFGVNEDSYDPAKHDIVSTSICDANAIAPTLHILQRHFGVEHGFVTTLHPWLSYQNLSDGSVRTVSSPGHYWKDFSLGRATTMSLIPKETTALDAVKVVLPEVAARVDAISFRIPTGIVATSDITIALSKRPTAAEINKVFEMESNRSRRIVGYDEEQLVSIDYLGMEQSFVFDPRWTKINAEGLCKLVVWYDNELGYSQRVVDMVDLMAKFI